MMQNDWQTVETQLAEALAQKKEKEKLEADLQQIREKLEEQSQRLAELQRSYAKEQKDVDRLEQTSLKSLFYSVLGSREEQMDRERQEALAARLHAETAQRSLDFLQAEKAHFEERLWKLRDVEKEYQRLLVEKERILRDLFPTLASDLSDIDRQMGDLRAELKEIGEALRAGKAADQGLDGMIEALRSAESWGVWDMLGGGMISTAVKHSRIDEAREAAHQVQAQISRFQRELADVQRSMDLTVDIGGLETFADYFFDGLIMDWVVQSKIQRSLDGATRTQQVIRDALRHMKQLESAKQTQLTALQTRRAAWLEMKPGERR